MDIALRSRRRQQDLRRQRHHDPDRQLFRNDEGRAEEEDEDEYIEEEEEAEDEVKEERFRKRSLDPLDRLHEVRLQSMQSIILLRMKPRHGIKYLVETALVMFGASLQMRRLDLKLGRLAEHMLGYYIDHLSVDVRNVSRSLLVAP